MDAVHSPGHVLLMIDVSRLWVEHLKQQGQVRCSSGVTVNKIATVIREERPNKDVVRVAELQSHTLREKHMIRWRNLHYDTSLIFSYTIQCLLNRVLRLLSTNSNLSSNGVGFQSQSHVKRLH